MLQQYLNLILLHEGLTLIFLLCGTLIKEELCERGIYPPYMQTPIKKIYWYNFIYKHKKKINQNITYLVTTLLVKFCSSRPILNKNTIFVHTIISSHGFFNKPNFQFKFLSIFSRFEFFSMFSFHFFI